MVSVTKPLRAFQAKLPALLLIAGVISLMTLPLAGCSASKPDTTAGQAKAVNCGVQCLSGQAPDLVFSEHPEDFLAAVAQLDEPLNGEILFWQALAYKQLAQLEDYITSLRLAVKQSYPEAYTELGQAYDGGIGVEANLLTALDYYRQAKQLQKASATITFFNSDGAEQSAAEVLDSLTLKARAGNIEAQYALGEVYDHGVLTQHNPARALHWYQRAADGGDEYANLITGYFFCRGIGTEVNHELAERYLRRHQSHPSCNN